MKIYKIIFIIIFFVILLMPLCFTNFKQNQISEIDNSKLPEISEVNNVSTLDNYFAKRIGFRTEIINTYTELNDKIFNKMVHPTYTYGTNGYVFFKTGFEEHDDEYLDTFANMVKEMQDYSTQRGKYFLFVLNPTKISVYSQYLPKGYNFTNYRVNYLKKKLDELQVNYIDNTECLIEKSNDIQVFNVKYDAGHWNENGGFIGINNIYNKMINDGIDISKLDLNDYTVSTQLMKSLPVSEFKINEEVPVYNLNKRSYIIDKRYDKDIEISKSHSYFIKTVNENAENKSNLLFFRGSYMNSKEKFVSNKFKEAYFVHNYDNSINFDYYINITDPDIVLFETVEYAIGDGYYSSEEMKAKKYNKLYDNFKDLPQTNDLIVIDTNEIIKTIEDNINNSIALSNIVIDSKEFEYAYLKVNNKIYDFTYSNLNASITLDTQMLHNATNIELIVINKNCNLQQSIKIK